MSDQSVNASGRVSRKWLYIPFIVAGIVAIAWYFAWRFAAGELEKGVLAWVDDQRDAGMEISHGAITPDGFPFFLRVHVDDAVIASPGEWRWATDRLSLDAVPTNLNRLILTPRGQQMISADGFGEWHLTADDFRASISGNDDGSWKFALNLAGVDATRAEDDAKLTIGNLVMDLGPDTTTPTTLVLSLIGSAIVPDMRGTTLTLDNLQLVTLLSETHALSGDYAAAQWRGLGGRMTINGLYATIDETTKIQLSGDVGLDQDYFPAGALNAEIANPAPLALLLGSLGVIPKESAEQAAAGLSLTAMAGGGKIAAPIILKNGTAQIAGVTVANLKSLD